MILISEYSPSVRSLTPNTPNASYDKSDPDYLTCDTCNADIFVSYFECEECRKDICPGCYVSGRGCRCLEEMKPAVVVPFDEILSVRNECADALSRASGTDVLRMTDT